MLMLIGTLFNKPNSFSLSISQMSIFNYLLVFLLAVATTTAAQKNGNVSCPLDFNVLRMPVAPIMNLQTQCDYFKQGLRLVQSDYLRRTGNFLPPLNSAESCWRAYQTLINRYVPNFDIRSRCGFQTSWISEGCMNITTIPQFQNLIPSSTLEDVVYNCSQSLENSSPCAVCTTSLSRLQAFYLTGSSVGNVSDCFAFPMIYGAALANPFRPEYKDYTTCLFSLDLTESRKKSKKNKGVIAGVSIGCGTGLLLIFGGACFFLRKRAIFNRKRKMREAISNTEKGLESISDSTTLVRLTFDEIKKATVNFSRDNMIGRGGYGNVYKGILLDGTEVALKRFKNCSAAGDANFKHEVEVIASVRHVNLVALRGYCIGTTQLEGHQRIIACDLMTNGSLYDHLFGTAGRKLSWPMRQKIALGTARGLAYLHCGAEPAILHRDIKASNILLDEMFEPKVGDFGLAKFYPEGLTHLSTRVAGTMGYVAPEYALYGQLTERTDVYSYGVVLLELLSGRKALTTNDDGQPSLVTDWAWSLVKNGRSLDVIEDGMPELGTPEVLEKYVMIAVLCSHPQLYARPTMDQVVKMLESELSVPTIPELPISDVVETDEIEKSMSSTS